MRVFNLNNRVSCALLSDFHTESKQSNENPDYILKIHTNCQVDHNSIFSDSWMKTLSHLKTTLNKTNVLCLESPIDTNQVNLAEAIRKEPIAPLTKEVIDHLEEKTSEVFAEISEKTTEAFSQMKKKATETFTKIVKTNRLSKIENIPEEKSKRKSYRPKKIKNYLIKYRFHFTNLTTSSFPIFLFCEPKTPELITQNLAKKFNYYWYELHKNLFLKAIPKVNVEHENNISCGMHKDPEMKLKGLAEIFNKLEKQFLVNILGVFIDPYFINKKDNQFIAEHVVDKRSSLSISDLVMDGGYTQQVSPVLNMNNNLQLSDSEVSECKLDLTERQSLSSDDSLSSIDNIILSADSDSIESNLDDSETFFLEEKNKNLDKDNAEVSRINEVELVCNPVQQDVLTSMQSMDNPLTSREENTSNWDLEKKEKIKQLLLAYQKNLAKKQYFFRAKDVTTRKQSLIEELLDKLNHSTYQLFSHQVFDISTINILNKHRDSFFIQKLGFFFKRHCKTKGSQLLTNIVNELNENYSKINTYSV